MDCQLLQGRPGGHSTHLLVVGCGNENISRGLLPRKGGGPGQSCWLVPQGPREGAAGVGGLWFPSSFFLGSPAPTRETSRFPATPSLGTLTLSFLPSLHMGRSFRQCYYSIEPFPGLRQGWSYREREEQVEVIAVKQMGTRTDE